MCHATMQHANAGPQSSWRELNLRRNGGEKQKSIVACVHFSIYVCVSAEKKEA